MRASLPTTSLPGVNLSLSTFVHTYEHASVRAYVHACVRAYECICACACMRARMNACLVSVEIKVGQPELADVLLEKLGAWKVYGEARRRTL